MAGPASIVSISCMRLRHLTYVTARAFLQLASSAPSTSGRDNDIWSNQTSPPEFLVPSLKARRHDNFNAQGTQITRLSSQTWKRESRRDARLQRRAFHVSPARSATIAVINARKDDDGEDMMIEITPRAANRLIEIMAIDGNPNLALRIQVESGGCHGFQYLMSLVTLPQMKASYPETPAASTEDANDDTVFEVHNGEESGEDLGEGFRARVVMDEPSLELLKGSKVDFTMELIGSQFKIADNPLATSSCGCGTSFDVKV